MTAVAAILGLISELLGIAVKLGTATAEQRAELEKQADESYARCRAAVFQLGINLDANNAEARADVDKKFPPSQPAVHAEPPKIIRLGTGEVRLAPVLPPNNPSAPPQRERKDSEKP